MKSIKSLLTLALIAATGLSLSACDERDFAFGAGLVAGIIIGDHHHHHHPRPRPPRYRGHWAYSTMAIDLSHLPPSERVALKYGLSAEQADILTTQMLRVQNGDLEALEDLGLEKRDLVALYKGNNPSASTLLTLSEKLDLDIQQAHALIQAIKSEVILARETMM